MRAAVRARPFACLTLTLFTTLLGMAPGTARGQAPDEEARRRLGDPESLAEPPVPEEAPIPPPPTPGPGRPGDAADEFGFFPDEDAIEEERITPRRQRQRRAALLEAETRGLEIPNQVATRLRILDRDLTALAARSGGSVVDGVLSIVAGGVSISLGVVLRNEPIAPFLYLVGGAAIARGVLSVTLVPNAQEPAVHFSHLPMTTRQEVRTRLEYGESALEHLAERQRVARLVDAGLNLAVGVAIIPIWLGPNGFTLDEAVDYFIVISAGISILSGVISLLSTTDAERRWAAYRDLRDRLESERERTGRDDGWAEPDRRARPGPAEVPVSPRALSDGRTGSQVPIPRLGATPIRGGGMLGMGWSF